MTLLSAVSQATRATSAAAAVAVAGLLTGCSSTGSHPTASTASATSAPAINSWTSYGNWLTQRTQGAQFSGTVLVAHDGQILLDQGYGLADRAQKTANAPATKFCIASMGKMFTAVAVAQLVEQGKLSFQDTIGRYLPGIPGSIGDKVTVAELLTHTSGLADAALGSTNPPATLAGLMARIAGETLQFTPGARFSYSNDGFIVLGAIVEKVSGVSYDDYVHQHILEPAGMTDTDVRAYTPAQVAGMAHGYTGSPATDDSDRVQVVNPSGGAMSTVGDMFKFAQALRAHRLLTAEMTSTVLAGKVKSGRPGGPAIDMYGYGFADQTMNGVRFVGHNGGTPGYEGELDLYPASGDVVVILTNQDQVLTPAIRESQRRLTGSPVPAASTAVTTSSGPGSSKPQQYVLCMRAHGEPKFPDPVDGHLVLTPDSGIDPSSAEFQAAEKACASLAPAPRG